MPDARPAASEPQRPKVEPALPLPELDVPEPTPEAPKRRRRWVRIALIALVAYLVLAVATFVQPVPVPFTSVGLTAPLPFPATWLFGLPDEPFTVLVVGLDRRPAQTGPSRTDTILLIRIDPGNDRAGMLSVPRDSLMRITLDDGSVIQDRVNTAFVYNWDADDASAGPRALARAIEDNLGIRIDHYLVFDVFGAADVIDAFDGVTIENDEAFGQDDYSADDINVVPQYFPVGRLHLDGYQAVAFGRIREGTTDFRRIERQQMVARALIGKAASPTTVWRLPRIWSAYRSAVTTDLSLRQSAGVLALLKRMDDRLVTRSLGDAAVSCSWCQASIQLLDPDETARLIAEAFGDDESGLRAAEHLRAAGITP